PILDNKYTLHKNKSYKQLKDKHNDNKAFNYILFKEQLPKTKIKKSNNSEQNNQVLNTTNQQVRDQQKAIENSLNKREDISLEQKKEIKQRTKNDLKNQQKEEQETKNILSQIVEDRDLSFIPSSSELEKL